MPDRLLQILIVDDNRSAADALARVLRKAGDVVEVVYDGTSALQRIQEGPLDLVLTDLKMEPVDGMAVLATARAKRPPLEVIVFTAFGAIDVAVRAMRMGARDFLTKPVTVDQLQQRLEALRARPAEDGVMRPLVAPVRVATPPLPTNAPFIAHGARSQALVETLQRCASVPSPVWISGEIGSGRTHCAVTLHKLGRAETPFEVRDLTRDDPWPDIGTVVLPDVGDLPDDLQRALLRSLHAVPPGVRLVATSGPDSRLQIAEGTLRAELFYALAVVEVPVPPLRERPEDVMPLLRESLGLFATRYGRAIPTVPEALARAMAGHSWPGNVRELRNLAERAVVMGIETVELDPVPYTPTHLPTLAEGFDLSVYLESVERQILLNALQIAKGDRNMVSRLLGVERNTLRYKLNKYGLLDKS